MNNRTRSFLRRVASPHYYHGRSVSKLALNNFLQLISFAKTPRPASGVFRDTKILKGSKKGKIALVLGAGPSLNKLNTHVLDKYVDDVFVINAFNQLKISSEVRPAFYGLSDPAHFKNLSGIQATEFEEIKNYAKFNESTFVLPHSAFQADDFINAKKIFFDDRELAVLNRNLSPLKPRSYGSTTIYKMLALAVYFEYDHIYILGFDNTNFLNYRGRPDNFIHDLGGAVADKKSNKKSAFIEEYEREFTSGMAGRMQSYSHLFGDLLKFRNFPISNLDPYSLTDAFPKILNHPLITD